MKLPQLYDHVGAWLDGSGPLSDIVISSRIRLARNIAGYVFFSQASKAEQAELLNYVQKKIMSTELKEGLWFLAMEKISPLEKHLLAERHLISKELSEGEGARGVALSHDESLALMINEEDHLRIQAMASGLQLFETYESIGRVDDLLEEHLSYAFSPKYGYLTACPTNVGTGMRVSVMLHLPGLKMTGEIEKFFRAAKDMRLAVRGFFGEGSEPIGDFYQLSNETTLGKTEEQIIDELVTQTVEPVVEYERRARQKLLDSRLIALDDKIFRARGILSSARLISSEETLYMLSFIRMGIHLGRIKDISPDTVNKLFLLSQPAHLQHICQASLDATERDRARADFIRKQLG